MALRDRLIFNGRWHRRIGLLCTLFVLLLAVTGILLNHTNSLKLDRIKLHSPLLAALYNLPAPQPVSFRADDKWLSHDGIKTLFLGQQAIEQCQAPLKGVIASQGLLQVLCHDELLLLTDTGDLLERITPLLGLPANTESLALEGSQLLLKTTTATLSVDLDSLAFIPANPVSPVWASAQIPPAGLAHFLTLQGPAMSLEQVLLDLHSGRLFGPVGVLIMDFVAILLIVLSITGFIVWRTGQKMRKR